MERRSSFEMEHKVIVCIKKTFFFFWLLHINDMKWCIEFCIIFFIIRILCTRLYEKVELKMCQIQVLPGSAFLLLILKSYFSRKNHSKYYSIEKCLFLRFKFKWYSFDWTFLIHLLKILSNNKLLMESIIIYRFNIVERI